MSKAEREYALLIYQYAMSAIDDSDTPHQAMDLLVDAAAMVISEGGGTLEVALDRIKESTETFIDAELMARHGGRVQ